MKIYFTGAHSVGKSTLVHYVSKKYSIPMITEVARMVLSEKELQIDSLKANLDVIDEYQSAVFDRQLEEEKKHKSFVSDRSFDFITYAAQHSRVTNTLARSEFFNKYIDGLREKDVYIFFVRPSKITMKQDGVREILTWDGIISIDAMIKFFLEFANIRYFQINTESMQERVRLVDAILSCNL